MTESNSPDIRLVRFFERNAPDLDALAFRGGHAAEAARRMEAEICASSTLVRRGVELMRAGPDSPRGDGAGAVPGEVRERLTPR